MQLLSAARVFDGQHPGRRRLGKQLAFQIAIITFISTGIVDYSSADAAEFCGSNGVCVTHNPGSRILNLKFRGNAITHFNVRYSRADGLTIQREIGTPGSNSSEGYLRDIETGKAKVAVQACRRNRFTGSKCTEWYAVRLIIRG